MKKRSVLFSVVLFLFSLLVTDTGLVPAQEISNAEVIRELKAMKARLDELEKEIQRRDQRIKELEEKAVKTEQELTHAKGHAAGRVPMEGKEEGEAHWTDRIKLSGLLEVEGSTERFKSKDPSSSGQEKTSRNDDLTLATVELGAEVSANKYVTGNIRLLYEQDETDLTVDEGTITIGGIEETYGFYGIAGRYYPHFGGLHSYMVSDPLTLEIFEIQETAVQLGWKNDWFTTGLGAFRGDVLKKGEEEDRIRGFFADVHVHNPEGTWGGLGMVAGASFLNNVGETDTLQGPDGLNGNPVQDRIAGAAGYLTLDYDRFGFGAEYISALDSFEEGEMQYALDRDGNPRRSRPAAWNFELAFRPVEGVQVAGRYEGSKDMFGLYPKSQFGLCVSWRLFEYTTLSGEYLRGKFDEDNRRSDGLSSYTRDLVTFQLALEF